MHQEQRERNLKYWAEVGHWLLDLAKEHQIWIPEFIAEHEEDFAYYIEEDYENQGVDYHDGQDYDWENTGMDFFEDFFGGFTENGTDSEFD
mmetsp:Transcript_23605/g.20967  ORF Transcript_23605/g.20967 Transcript_23605/m.20967 type:complete len:91 (+) Transcript_23605:107-379(+)